MLGAETKPQMDGLKREKLKIETLIQSRRGKKRKEKKKEQSVKQHRFNSIMAAGGEVKGGVVSMPSMR